MNAPTSDPTTDPTTDLAIDPAIDPAIDLHQATLLRWQTEEAAMRSRQAAPGVALPEQVAGLSGIQVFHAMLEGRLPSPHIGHQMHFVLMQVETSVAVFQGRPDRSCYNPLGSVHGGWFATLLDSAVGCAVHSTLPPGKGYTTLELKLNIVRALTDRVPLVRAEGRVLHGGRQVATAEGRLVGHDGKLYAHATTTCLVFDARP